MIYMVECALTAQQSDAEWDRWYHSMKPPHVLPSVPGISTTQRFKGVNVAPPAYFAMYSVETVDVMQSAAYKNAGGGRFQTDDWKPMITFWNRDVFDGMDAPDVPMDSLLLVLDRAAPEASLAVSFSWLRAAGLDRSTPYRGLAVVPQHDAQRLPLTQLPGVRVFRPVIPQVSRAHPLPERYLDLRYSPSRA